MKRQKLISVKEANVVTLQHTKPCTDCPWARTSLRGWLGDLAPSEWIAAAHGEATVECHTQLGAQCAGIAIYRANVTKQCRSRAILRLPPDRRLVFASPAEFLRHHIGVDDDT